MSTINETEYRQSYAKSEDMTHDFYASVDDLKKERYRLENKISWGLFTTERYAREASDRLNWLNEEIG